MPEEIDLLHQMWVEIINLDSKGFWMEACVNSVKGKGKPFSNLPRVLSRLLEQGASPEDLGRVARAHRYIACFGMPYAADDPGLKDGTARGLADVFAGVVSGKHKGRIREKAFISALVENVGIPNSGSDSDGDSLAEEVEESSRGTNEPFADAEKAVVRLQRHGKSADIELLIAWHRYDAIRKLLQLLDRRNTTMSEVAGLHEQLLSAEPTGKDARPGSWPLPAGKTVSPGDKTPPHDAPAPAFVLKLSYFEFSPVEPVFVGIPRGLPPRMFDVKGAERFVLEARRPGMWFFALDGKRIFFAAENTITSCDTKTGKCLATVSHKMPNGHIARLHPVPGRQELLVVQEELKNQPTIDPAKHSEIVLNATTLEVSRPLRNLFPTTCRDFQFIFSPDGSRLAALWRDNFDPKQPPKLHFTEWSWPDLKTKRDVELPPGLADDPIWLPKRNCIIVNRDYKFVQLSPDTGKLQPFADAPDAYTCFAVSPDESKLLSGTLRRGHLTLYDMNTGTALRKWDSGEPGHHIVEFSSNGETIGSASPNKCQFWRLASLLH